MRVFGWIVLAVVFAVELAACVAFGIWGWDHRPRLLLVWLVPVLAIVAWGLFAAPRARFDSAPMRAVTQVVVFGLAVLALDTSGHPVAATVLLAVVVVSHLLAALPPVRRLQAPMSPDVSRSR